MSTRASIIFKKKNVNYRTVYKLVNGFPEGKYGVLQNIMDYCNLYKVGGIGVWAKSFRAFLQKEIESHGRDPYFNYSKIMVTKSKWAISMNHVFFVEKLRDGVYKIDYNDVSGKCTPNKTKYIHTATNNKIKFATPQVYMEV